jgi:hypothetical protein
VLYTASTSAYNPTDLSGAPINRWGDYSYTSLDPNDDMTMWTIQEFCNAPNSYRVQVVRLLAPPPAIPASCSPASVAAGAGNVNVVVTGTSNGDTGFFDPGAGFSNRIAGAVSGNGVTVNSIVYTDPTHVTLNFSVSSGAAGGGRTLTITNPDGQNATSTSAILTVVGGVTNSPPVLAPIANRTIHQGTTLAITNTATDASVPVSSLSFNLVNNIPAGATINSSTGVLLWTPGVGFVNTTNALTVQVSDNGTPPLTDAQSFTVTVVSRPIIKSVALTNSLVTIAWSAVAGQAYTLQYAQSLGATNWTDLSPSVIATGSLATTINSVGGVGQRFYRVRVLP